MAKNTKNYQLTKPEGTDLVDIDVLNENFDVIDTQLKKNADALGNKQDSLIFDDTPTEGSSNPVTSGGIYTELEEIQDRLEFDETPTEGSTKPVTSGGIYTALQTAGATPDWDENGSTAADYILNRPFYRTIASSETIRSVDILEGIIGSYSPNWVSSRGYRCDSEIIKRQEYKVTATYNGITVVRNIKAVWKGDCYALDCDEFRVKYIPANYTSGPYNILSISYAIAVFGEYKSFYCSFKVELVTYNYTTIPEEYLDTSFAAPEFSDAKYVSEDNADYDKAYLLLFAGENYYRNKAAAVFSALLAGTDLSARLDDLEAAIATLENENQFQAEQIRALNSRVAYLESLHRDGDMIISEADSVLSIDGSGASVEDGGLILNSADVSVTNEELVYESGSSDTMGVDEDGTLNLSGSGIAAADGELTVNSGSISVSDETLTTDAESQADVTDGVVSVNGSVDESGVFDLGGNADVEDGTVLIE